MGAEVELVTVTSLGASCLDNLTHVYDVHLTEGRSFHAKGYLVSVNYPEVRRHKLAPSRFPFNASVRMAFLFLIMTSCGVTFLYLFGLAFDSI